MNAIFGMKISISIGEKMMALIGTGTGVYLPGLPPPTIPKIVQGNSWTNVDKINELNRSLEEAVNRNREIYQLKVYGVSANYKIPYFDSLDEFSYFLFTSSGFR